MQNNPRLHLQGIGQGTEWLENLYLVRSSDLIVMIAQSCAKIAVNALVCSAYAKCHHRQN
jgi:hypothetical protein